jgi:hypothetical protein
MLHVPIHRSPLRTRGTPFHPILCAPSYKTHQRPLQKSNYGGLLYPRKSQGRTGLNVERAAVIVVPPELQADYPSAPTFSRRRNIQHTRLDKVSSTCAPTHLSPFPLIPGPGPFHNMGTEETVTCQCRPYHPPLPIIRPQLRQLNRP